MYVCVYVVRLNLKDVGEKVTLFVFYFHVFIIFFTNQVSNRHSMKSEVFFSPIQV